ncbi:putative choline transporter, neither null mutation nor overexpression affects choline transport [Serendipita sp. 400]|nr:putative choline transporter, neither null mutation nor overexpression affects choline transport [Serendipita sp. 400]
MQSQPSYAPAGGAPVWNSQPYAQQYSGPSGPPPAQFSQQSQYPPNNGKWGEEGNDHTGHAEPQRFKPKKKWNDIPFLIFYILTVAGFATVSGLALYSWVKNDGGGGGLGGSRTGNKGILNSSTVYLLLLTTACSMVLTLLYMILLRAFPKPILHVSLILTPIGALAVAIYYFYVKYYSGAIIFVVFVILFAFVYLGYRKRVPMAAMFLNIVLDIAKHHKMGVYGTAIIAIIVQAGVGIWFVFTIVATYLRWGNAACQAGSAANPTSNTSCTNATLIGLIIFEVFAYLWMSQVIANVTLATLAGGPFGSWYYFGPRGQGMPPHPTRSSFVRASTLSLGSIAFGSLIVTLLQLIRMLLNWASQNAAEDGNPVVAILACCAACFVGCIEGLVEYFNKYAYIEIALYGKPYIKAAKDTWSLITDRGVDAIINDTIVALAMTWGSFFIGLLCVLFAYVYLRATKPAYNSDGSYTPAILVYAWFVGFQVAQSLTASIDAGVSTIFVGLAEHPEILQQRAPALFNLIAQDYPRVVHGIHGTV